MLFKQRRYWPLFYMQEGVPFETIKRGSCICDCEERGEEEEREQLIYIKAPSTSPRLASAAAATIVVMSHLLRLLMETCSRTRDSHIRLLTMMMNEWDEAAERVAKKKHRTKICSADGCVDQVVKGGLCIQLQKSSLQSTTGPDDWPLLDYIRDVY